MPSLYSETMIIIVAQSSLPESMAICEHASPLVMTWTPLNPHSAFISKAFFQFVELNYKKRGERRERGGRGGVVKNVYLTSPLGAGIQKYHGASQFQTWFFGECTFGGARTTKVWPLTVRSFVPYPSSVARACFWLVVA